MPAGCGIWPEWPNGPMTQSSSPAGGHGDLETGSLSQLRASEDSHPRKPGTQTESFQLFCGGSKMHAEPSRLSPIFYGAYCAMPLPNDQFSFFTSTRPMNTSSMRTPSSLCSRSATALKKAFFISSVRPSFSVI